uniref:DUF4325 domain-containing protein n=1 Tax=Meloidogyne hapla TaxID=6305 RepID=A0A1I8C0H2_MELHA
MVGIKFEPNHALIRKNSKVKVSISFSGVDLSSNMRRRIALIFMNTTKDRSINELFLGDGIYGRKELM